MESTLGTDPSPDAPWESTLSIDPSWTPYYGSRLAIRLFASVTSTKQCAQGSGTPFSQLLCAKGPGFFSLRVAPRDEEECQGVRSGLLLEAALL